MAVSSTPVNSTPSTPIRASPSNSTSPYTTPFASTSVFASSTMQSPPMLPADVGELSSLNASPIRKGYKPVGVMTKEDGRFVVYTGPAGGMSYFHKTQTLDGNINIQQSTPNGKYLINIEKF